MCLSRYTSSEGSVCSRGIIHLLTVFSALHAHFNKLELSVLLRCCSYRKIGQLSIYQVDLSQLKGCFLSVLTAHLHICAAVISEPLTSHRILRRILLPGADIMWLCRNHTTLRNLHHSSPSRLFSAFLILNCVASWLSNSCVEFWHVLLC